MKLLLTLGVLLCCMAFTSNVNADKAIFAGGCFWCMESDFEKLEGVTDVISGFTVAQLATLLIAEIIKVIMKRWK